VLDAKKTDSRAAEDEHVSILKIYAVDGHIFHFAC
jgi:hypothetical protein